MIDPKFVDEGYQAGKNGVGWGDCPYLFSNSNTSLAEYNSDGWFDKRDGWWVGWCVVRRKDPGHCDFRHAERELLSRIK